VDLCGHLNTHLGAALCLNPLCSIASPQKPAAAGIGHSLVGWVPQPGVVPPAPGDASSCIWYSVTVKCGQRKVQRCEAAPCRVRAKLAHRLDAMPPALPAKGLFSLASCSLSKRVVEGNSQKSRRAKSAASPWGWHSNP